MTRLSVNVNKIAVLLNSRGGTDPDVVRAAMTCLRAGAHGASHHAQQPARALEFQRWQAGVSAPCGSV